jgi:hypothetical protein
VLKALCRELRCQKEQLGHLVILRRSLDARMKDQEPRYILLIEVDSSGKPPMRIPSRQEKAPKPAAYPIGRVAGWLCNTR